MERSQENTPPFRVIKDDTSQVYGQKEFENLMQFRFVPCLDFEDFLLFQAVIQKTKQAHSKKKLSEQQLWLGCYFEKELQGKNRKEVEVRWIDDLVGWGVFARTDLLNMTFIAEYEGIVRRKRSCDPKNAYCFEYLLHPEDQVRYLIDAQDQGGISRFINHSDTPNLMASLATVRGLTHVVLFTSRPVQKGEQLVYDYGLNYWKHRKKRSF